MSCVGFESTITAFEWAKTFRALDRAAKIKYRKYNSIFCRDVRDVHEARSLALKEEHMLVILDGIAQRRLFGLRVSRCEEIVH
jgi:hypothetical protein